LWAALLLTSDVTHFDLALSFVLLGLFCFGLPAIGTFCVYVTIDEATLTVPMAVVLRRSIPIKDIQQLTLRKHGIGLLEGIIVQYVNFHKQMESVRLPSISTFGRTKTSEMVKFLVNNESTNKTRSEDLRCSFEKTRSVRVIIRTQAMLL
jgi:hypothetical protein